MSALPKQVQRQIEEANRIAELVYKTPPAGEGQPPAGDPPAGNPPAGDPPPNPNGGTPPQGAAPPAGGEPPAGGQPAEWEQRYKVLQGKYNAEVPRLQRRLNEQEELVRDMRQQLTATQNLLASLSQQRGTPSAEPPAGNPPANKLVKDDEIKEFGPDLLDVVRRAAREEIMASMPAFEQRMQPVAQRAEQAAQAATHAVQRVARNDEQSVLELLDEKVPTWRELNRDPEFLAWLDQQDPFSGAVRGALLDQAYKAFDGPRVVRFFDGYLKEHAAVNPPPTPPAAQGGNPPAAQPQKKLDDFIAPGAPKPGAAVAPDGSGKRVFTRAEISKFYVDCTAGRYKDEAKRKAMEAEIFAAQREGRIR